MSGPYYYYLAHRTLNDSEADAPCWELPPGTVGAVDLCSRSQEAQPVFVATSEPLDSSHTYLGRGDCREMAVDGAMLSAWESAVGYRPNGERLVDLLWDQLTDGADPSGEGRCKPLMPTVAGRLELWLPGHSLVKSERFVFGKHKHTKQVREVIQRDLRKTFAECCKKKGKKDQEHYRKVLDYHAKQYRADWREFVPSDIAKDVPGPLKHETTVSDDFNRPLGPIAGNWDKRAGTWRIVSEKAYGATSSNNSTGYASLLSGTNHYVSCKIITDAKSSNGRQSVLGRLASTGTESYAMFWRGPTAEWDLLYIAGNLSSIKLATSDPVYPHPFTATAMLRIDGSTLSGFVDSVPVLNATDTRLTSGLRCGMYAYGAMLAFSDDWQASDLSIPPTGNRRRRLLITGTP